MLYDQDLNQERDINDLFDDIVLTEERFVKSAYEEGFAEGCQQGNAEGYRLGYSQGIQLGEELAEIYGFVIARQQEPKHTERVNRCLQQLRDAIEIFPRDNDPEADIVGALEQIRIANKKLRTLLGVKTAAVVTKAKETKDLSF